MLKIKQSYHGTGSAEGYEWKVYNGDNILLGELNNFPYASVGSIMKLNGDLYILLKEYDSIIPEEIDNEVVYYELAEYEFKPDFELKYI